MARGPAPKDPRKRARQNKDAREFKYVQVRAASQPDLPDVEIGEDPDLEVPIYMEWPEVTLDWWERWGRSPMAESFTADDWDELRISAFLHAQFWKTGDIKAAAELRQRTAKFGATPEDRARLRVQYVMADDAERKSSRARGEETPSDTPAEGEGGARERYGYLRAVPD